MGHARPDTANVGDVLLAEPHRVRFAGRALLRGPLLRGGGRRREREREAQKRRSGYDRPEVWTNVHYLVSIVNATTMANSGALFATVILPVVRFSAGGRGELYLRFVRQPPA
jgi:hypothetical protein